MSIERIGLNKQNLEQQITSAATQGFKFAKLIIQRSAVLIAGDLARPSEAGIFIPAQRLTETMPLDVEVKLRKSAILENCRLAFELAVATQLETHKNVLLPAPGKESRSEYVSIASIKGTPLYLHRPNLSKESDSRYAYWLRERVEVGEENLNLPFYTYREYGLDAQGNLEEKQISEGGSVVYRTLDDYESVPYYRSLTPITLYTMAATPASSISS